MSYGGGNPSRLAQGSSTYGSTGGYTSSTGGGYAAGATGGSTGGYAAGTTGGSTGGYAAGSTGGYTSGATGGSTGGYTAAATGGSTGGYAARTTTYPATTSAGGYAAPSTAAAYSGNPPQPRTSVSAVPSTTGGGYSGSSAPGSTYSSPSASYASNPAPGYAVSQQQQQATWVLEPVQYAGVAYLLDRTTNTVYVNNQGFMQIAGKWQNGQLVQRVRNNTGELFKALDDLLRTQQVSFTDFLNHTLFSPEGFPLVFTAFKLFSLHLDCICAAFKMVSPAQVRFTDLFKHFDTDGSGTLEVDELRVLVKQLLPNVTEQELRYFQVCVTTA